MHVEFSEVKKSLLKGKTLFFNVNVTLGGKVYSCKRKYEEFVTLAECLRNRLRGSSIPPLNKRGIGNESDSVVNMINGLQAFLIAVVRHPFLKTDTAFLYFFTSTDKFKPKYLENLKVKETEQSKGFQMWAHMIQLCSTPSKPMSKLKMIFTEINTLRTFYRSFKQAVRTHIARLETHAAGVNEFGNSFENWKLMEGMELPMLAGVVSLENGQEQTTGKNLPISNMVSHLESTCVSESEKLKKKSKELAKIVSGPLSFELMVLESMKDDIKATREIIFKYKKASKKYKDALDAYNRSVARKDDQGSSAAPERLKQTMDAARITRNLALEEAHFVTRGFLVVEIQRFRHERANRAADILKKIAALNLDFAGTVAKLWENSSSIIPSGMKSCSDLRVLEDVKERDSSGILTRGATHLESFATITEFNGEEESPRDEQEEEEKSQQLENDDSPEEAERRTSVRVIQSYAGEHERELSIKFGDIMEGLISSANPEWVWVTDPKSGAEGYVPSTHVEVMEERALPNEQPVATQESNLTTNVVPAPVEPPKPQGKPDILASIQGFNKTALKSA